MLLTADVTTYADIRVKSKVNMRATCNQKEQQNDGGVYVQKVAALRLECNIIAEEDAQDYTDCHLPQND